MASFLLPTIYSQLFAAQHLPVRDCSQMDGQQHQQQQQARLASDPYLRRQQVGEQESRGHKQQSAVLTSG